MTSQSPRIYIYKITFEEVLYYYYGVHKEKKFGEYYMGSSVTHKWCWDFYTPKKQILELFDYTDEGWLEAQEVEKRLIKPYYNTDKWCLNENCGRVVSLSVLQKIKDDKLGIFSFSKEERIENARNAGKIGGKMTYERGIGIFSKTNEEKIAMAKKDYNNGKGLGSITLEQRVENSKIYGVLGGRVSGKNHKKNKTGIFGLEKEQHIKNSKKGGLKNKKSWCWYICDSSRKN